MRNKYPNMELFLVHIFSYLDGIRKLTEEISVFSQNTGKHGPEKIRIWTFFAQCKSRFDAYVSPNNIICGIRFYMFSITLSLLLTFRKVIQDMHHDRTSWLSQTLTKSFQNQEVKVNLLPLHQKNQFTRSLITSEQQLIFAVFLLVSSYSN